MSKLNSQQKRLLFDYSFNLTTKTDTAQAKKLITSNSEAANICAKIKAALEPLKNLTLTTCPDSLAEKTLSICSNHRTLEKTISIAFPTSPDHKGGG
jgi:hypothetical protein